MWPFGVKRSWRHGHELLKLSKYDAFHVSDAYEGTLILGATGSGKSTGSGESLALSFLRAGFGGLVLTAKPDEPKIWERYCRKIGRTRDLRIFSPRNEWRFNFLDAELNRPGEGAGLTENLLHLFTEVLQVAERNAKRNGGDDEYWRLAKQQLCRNAIDLLVLAKGTVSVPDLYRIVTSAPKSAKQADSDHWKQSSFCFECLCEADERCREEDRIRDDFGIVADYFLLEFSSLASKTRSIVVSSFTSMIDVLNRGVLAEMFCTTTNLSPSDTESGAIIVIDLPVKEFRQVGVFGQVLWKTAFQRSMERRSLRSSPRPVFLWADEAQYFVTSPNDMEFQSTCRAFGVATVLLSQNVNNFYAALGGGDRGKAETDSIFGNLNTKIFHANACPVTNEWAASLIGRSRQFLMSSSNSDAMREADWFSSLMGWQGTQGGSSLTEHIDFEVQPRAFTTLRRGGRANGRQVEGIVFQGGRQFRATGKTWLPVTFHQSR